jgi:hypothetical protein
MDHMKNFQNSTTNNLLNDLLGGTVQSIAVGGASINIAVTSGSDIFEIGSLGEVKLERGDGDCKDLFTCLIEELSDIAGSQIAAVSVSEDKVEINSEDPFWLLTFERGIDYVLEVSSVSKNKGPAFFIG